MHRLRFAALLVIGLMLAAPTVCSAVLIDDFSTAQVPSSSPDTKTVGGDDGLAAGADRTLSGTVGGGTGGLRIEGDQLRIVTSSSSSAVMEYSDFPGGTIALGSNNVFDFNGTLLPSSSAVDWAFQVFFDSDSLINSGTWSGAGTSLVTTPTGTNFGDNVKGIKFTFSWGDGEFVNLVGSELTAIPEPSTFLLSGFAALGIVGLAFRSRRKKG